MKCNQIPQDTRWEDLSPRQLQAHRAHLESCDACRQRISSEAPEQLLFELQNPELPEDFWLGFWDSLEKKLEPSVEIPVPFFMPIVRWAAVFVVILILALYSRRIDEPIPANTATAVPRLAPDSSGYPLIEDVQNPKVRYYIFQPKGNENIVMMFDPDMEL